jgi:CDP-6-deoxy-D-xylo-4-hexulose-3-dehydrase
VKESAPFTVRELTRALNVDAIETRPIICGNVARQPAMALYEHRTVGDLRHADGVMTRAFSFGNHQAIDEGARSYVAERIRAFLAARGVV